MQFKVMTQLPTISDNDPLFPIRDARDPTRTHTVDDVRRYYEEKTSAYMEGFGDVFQGSRPASTSDLLNLIIKSADLYDGMNILDAGCGVCGPAIFFAKNKKITIEAMTISPIQVREAQTRVRAQRMENQITVREGDFHHLASIYPANSFDRILFLETICHAQDYKQVLEQAWKVLKPGGFLYIKDFYCQDFRSKPHLIQDQIEDLKALNRVYTLAMPSLPSLIDLLMLIGFKLKFVRGMDYNAVFEPWIQFEQVAGISWNPKLSHFDLIDAMELMVRKPVDA